MDDAADPGGRERPRRVRWSKPGVAAIGLWLVFAFVTWNVVFDRLIVLAGRRYVYAAVVSARQTGSYQRIDDWMRPATTQAVWTASVVAGLIAAVGVALTIVAVRKTDRDAIV